MSRFLILSGILVGILIGMVALIKMAILPGSVTAILVAALIVLYVYSLTQMDAEVKKSSSPSGKP